MTANELRVGNYINGDSKVYAIHAQEDLVYVSVPGGHGVCTISSCSPIPLTPEILEKAGFEYFEDDPDYTRCWLFPDEQGPWELIAVNDGFELYHEEDSSSLFVPVTKHLHQLQNLYFALTGQELDIAF